MKNKDLEIDKEIFNKLLQKYSLLEILEKNLILGNIDVSQKKSYILKCKNNYVFWDSIDQLTKEFLISAEIALDKIIIQDIDFSFVVLEFCKAFENELFCKIFKPYVGDIISRLRDDEINNYVNIEKKFYYHKSSGPLGDGIERVLKNGELTLTFGQMLMYINLTNNSDFYRENSNKYRPLIYDLRNYLFETLKYNKLTLNMDKLNNWKDAYRNPSAHTEYFTFESAISSKTEITKMINLLLSLFY